ncbi:MAG: sialidase family protein [Planctomycetota bacterium]|jgi:hypothetical protein
MRGLLTLWTLIACVSPIAAAAGEAKARLLLGFEDEQMAKIGRFDEKKGKRRWRAGGGYPCYLFGLNTDEKSQGKQSLRRGYEKGWAVGSLKSGKFQSNRPGVYRRAATLLRTSGWHSKALGSDWSGGQRLLVDVKSTGAAATLAIEVEDELAPLPLPRTYAVPKGRWVTLCYDLAAAGKAGLLDAGKITSLYVLLKRLEGPTSVYIDNVRLAGAGGKPALELVVDSSEWPRLPEPAADGAKTTRPKAPAAVTAKPDRSEIPGVEKPLALAGKGPAWGNSLHKVARGIGAFDNGRLVSVFMAPTGGLRCSSDGGRTWSGVDGEPSTVIATGNNTPNRHGFFCESTEVLAVYITHCAGGGSPTETYFRRVRFDGSKWHVGEASVVDRDVRHCPERYEAIRLADGRLWAAWDHYERTAGIPVRAKFSDDGGKTWQHGGRLGRVSPPLNLGSLPTLVSFGPDGAGIAYNWRAKHKVFFTRFDQEAFDKLHAEYLAQKGKGGVPWDRFATRSAWTPPEPLPKGEGVASALGTPDGRVFVAVRKPDCVLVWDGKAWTESLAGAAGILTRCGQRIVLVAKDKGGRKITVRVMSGDKWGPARTVAEEESAIKSLAVPRVSPPNFVPVAWSFTADKNAIRTLRVAIGTE